MAPTVARAGKMSELTNSLAGFYLMVSLQFGFKILTFGSNLILTRLLKLETIGNLQDAELLTSTILLVCRETMRMTLTRNTEQDSLQFQINYSYISWAIYGLLAPFLIGDTVRNMYLFGILFEILTEPLQMYISAKLLYRIRAKAESIAFMMQTLVVLCFCLGYKHEGVVEKESALKFYAAGQMIYGGFLLGAYLWQISRLTSLKILLPRAVLVNGKQSWQSSYYNSIAQKFVWQTILKYALTAADKFALVALNVSDYNKGAFRIVSDLGSLVARIVFAPLEEISRNYFSKALTKPGEKSTIVAETIGILRVLIQFEIIFGAVFALVGSNFTDILLLVLFNKNTPENSSLLSWYCVYIPVLGLNGVLEAFIQGVGSQEILKSQSLLMIVLWGLYTVLTLLFLGHLGLGSKGLLFANIITMVCRIIFAYRYTVRFYKDLIIGTDASTIDLMDDLSPRLLIPGTRLTWTMFILGWIVNYNLAASSFPFRLVAGISLFAPIALNL